MPKLKKKPVKKVPPKKNTSQKHATSKTVKGVKSKQRSSSDSTASTTSLADRLKKIPASKRKTYAGSDESVWKGPMAEGPQGGITQGLIGRYVSCGERFRLMVIDGWKEADRFNHRLEYGTMWHLCEEALAAQKYQGEWESLLHTHCKLLCERYPMQQEEIVKYYNICKTQFPIYVKWWSKHPDVKDRTPLMQEVSFDVPYLLPSGRTVRLRGKWDSVDLIGNKKSAVIYLQENKAKGEIIEQKMKRDLSFEIQTMTYLIALNEDQKNNMGYFGAAEDSSNRCRSVPIRGVRYNVVRRPLAGGKHSIRPHQATKKKPAETMEAFYKRLGGLMEDNPEFFFMRWKVDLSHGDLEKFKEQFLHPVLENLCDDYEWWDYCRENSHNVFDYLTRGITFPEHRRRHFRLPYGIYNPVAEDRSTEIDEYLASGSTLGLRRVEDMFPELA